MRAAELFGPRVTGPPAKSLITRVIWNPASLYGPPETFWIANEAFPLTKVTSENTRLSAGGGRGGWREYARKEAPITNATAANTKARNGGLRKRTGRTISDSQNPRPNKPLQFPVRATRGSGPPTGQHS